MKRDLFLASLGLASLSACGGSAVKPVVSGNVTGEYNASKTILTLSQGGRSLGRVEVVNPSTILVANEHSSTSAAWPFDMSQGTHNGLGTEYTVIGSAVEVPGLKVYVAPDTSLIFDDGAHTYSVARAAGRSTQSLGDALAIGAMGAQITIYLSPDPPLAVAAGLVTVLGMGLALLQ